MINRIHKGIYSLIDNPRMLFLIDGIGAFLTAFFLLFILADNEKIFGMPKTTLHFLSSVAFVYAIYSLTCFCFNLKKWKHYLIAIATANLIYCLTTIALVGYFYASMTSLGLSYFFLELLVMSCLVFIELKVLFYRPGEG